MIKEKSDNKTAFTYLLPTLLILLIIQIIPILSCFFLSFHDLKRENFMQFYFTPLTLKNYLSAFSGDFILSLFNIFVFGIIVIFFTFVIALSAGIFLRDGFPGKTILIGIILIPYFTMDSVAYGIWRIIFNFEIGIFNKFLYNIGIIKDPIAWLSMTSGNLRFIPIVFGTVWKSWPFMAIVLLGGLENIPREFYEASFIDGANKWQQFKYITIPILWNLLKPLLIISAIWIMHSFNNFYIMSYPDFLKIPSIVIINQIFNFNYGISSAMSIILLIFIIGITSILFYRKKEVTIEN